MSTFRALLGTAKPLIGTILTLPAPELAELAAQCGFDWLWLDIEHGLFEVADVQRAAMAAGDTPCFVRVPANDEAWIKRVLDTGVSGLIVPQVNSAELAEQAVRYTRYPPEGTRSAGMGRAYGYTRSFADYVARANHDLVLIIQVEHIQAVENLEPILDVQGIDAVIIGPFDLSASMGKIGQVDDPEVLEKIAAVRETCIRRGVVVGLYVTNTAAGRRALDEGYQLVILGCDIGMLGNAWSAAYDNLKGRSTPD
jgi:2-dehydro-3-deoxyglucarate aldolase/4-hydroxy-2-oxoheptanedioate aldolase